MNYEISTILTRKKIEDVLCSAVESDAITYWGKIDGAIKPKAKAKYIHEYPLRGGYLIVKDVEANHSKKYKLDEAMIMRGLTAMSRKDIVHFADIFNESGDNTTADLLIQYSLFGKVKYA